MDLKATHWYGQLQISGVASPVNFEISSLTQLSGQMLAALIPHQAKKSGDRKLITFLMSDVPFGDDKDKREKENQIREIENGLNKELIMKGPLDFNPHLTYQEYYDYQIAEGVHHNTAKFMCDDWFDQPKDTDLLAWLEDRQAFRFRQLNSSSAAFATAMPDEYDRLHKYVTERFPQFLDGLKLRKV